jgi:hypothetical protein
MYPDEQIILALLGKNHSLGRRSTTASCSKDHRRRHLHLQFGLLKPKYRPWCNPCSLKAFATLPSTLARGLIFLTKVFFCSAHFGPSALLERFFAIVQLHLPDGTRTGRSTRPAGPLRQRSRSAHAAHTSLACF